MQKGQILQKSMGMRRSVALFAEWRLDMCIKVLIVLCTAYERKIK